MHHSSLANLITRLSPRALWSFQLRSTVLHKGTLRWQQLQSGCFPDNENPETVESLQADNWQFTDQESRWPPQADEDRRFPDRVTDFFGWTEDEDVIPSKLSP